MGFEGIWGLAKRMAFSLHKDLLAGRYNAVAEKLLDGRSAKRALTESETASLVASLSFLGRMDEAEALFARLAKGKVTGPAVLAARFFLGIGFTRKSEYKSAQSAFALNAKAGAKTALEHFYVEQGKAFYAYYTGRVREAMVHAQKARRYALRSSDLFARSLATDAYGHCLVMTGEIHHGLRLLDEARKLAARMSNESDDAAIAISLELYDAEFGLTGIEGFHRLEQRWVSVGTEDNYSLANVGLELARQYTLRGRFPEAARTLERVAPAIYANQNRRQEITLNLRLAELSGRKGDFFGARHYLRFVQRLLSGEADSGFALAALGIERKLALSEGKSVNELDARWKQLTKEFSQTRNDHLLIRSGLLEESRENQEDRVHQVLRASRRAPTLSQKLRPLLEHGFLAEVSLCLGLIPGENTLVALPQALGLLVQTSAEISWVSSPLSSLQAKILDLLAKGDCDKEKLVEAVWGYRYDPLRHDPMVYSALSTLRKNLGLGAEWLQATESGYRLATRFFAVAESKKSISKAPVKAEPTLQTAPVLDSSLAKYLPLLNHRQIEILEWLKDQRFLGVGECRTRFDVSEITALRDLDGLRRQGLVVRNGKARATRYMLPSQGAPV